MKFKEIVKEMCGTELVDRIKEYQENIAQSKEYIHKTKRRIKILKQEIKNRYEPGE